MAKVDQLDRQARQGNAAEQSLAFAELLELIDVLDGRIEEAASDYEAKSYALPRFLSYRALGTYHTGETLDVRLGWFEEGIRSTDVLGNHEMMANARFMKGELLLGFGRTRAAREVFLETLEVAPEAEKTLPAVLYGLCETEARLALYDQALQRCDEVEAAVDPDGKLAKLKFRVAGTRGQIYLELGLPDLAAPQIEEEARGIDDLAARGGGTFKDFIASDVHRANLAVVSGNHEQALELVDAMLANEARYPEGSFGRGVLLAAKAESLVFLERADPGRERRAEEFLLEALEGDLPEQDRLRVEDRLSEILIASGRLDEAATYLESARARLASWRADEGGDRRNPEEIYVATSEARLALEGGVGPDELRERRDALADAFRHRVDLWQLVPPRAGGLGFLHHPHQRAWLSELVRLELALDPEGGAATALDWVLLAQAQGTLLRRLGGANATLAEVQAGLLGPRRGIVVFLPGPMRSHAFALEGDTVRHDTLAPEHELNRLRLDYVAALANRREVRADALAAELLRELFPEAVRARLAAWRGLTVVGTDLLGRLPVEYLPAPGGGYLGVALAVDRLPSLPLGVHLKRRLTGEGERPINLVLGAAPTPGPEARARWSEVGPLPWEDEEERIGAPFEPDARRAFTLGAATAANVLDAELLARSRGLVLLAHNALDRGRERPPTIVLSPSGEHDGLVTCDAMEALPLPPLVLLGSCRSAIGPPRLGDEGTGHLGGACLFAGARAVLLADEELLLGHVVHFSIWFLDYLAGGRSPAESAAYARRKLVEAGLVASPTEAGLIYVLGLGHEPVFEPRDVEVAVAPAPARELSNAPLGADDAAPPSESEPDDSRSVFPWIAGVLALVALALLGAASRLQRRAGP